MGAALALLLQLSKGRGDGCVCVEGLQVLSALTITAGDLDFVSSKNKWQAVAALIMDILLKKHLKVGF